MHTPYIRHWRRDDLRYCAIRYKRPVVFVLKYPHSRRGQYSRDTHSTYVLRTHGSTVLHMRSVCATILLRHSGSSSSSLPLSLSLPLPLRCSFSFTLVAVVVPAVGFFLSLFFSFSFFAWNCCFLLQNEIQSIPSLVHIWMLSEAGALVQQQIDRNHINTNIFAYKYHSVLWRQSCSSCMKVDNLLQIYIFEKIEEEIEKIPKQLNIFLSFLCHNFIYGSSDFESKTFKSSW